VHDPPGLEVRNDLLDDVADLVNLRIVFLLPVKELAAGGFLEGRDHFIADIAFVSEPAPGSSVSRTPDSLRQSSVLEYCLATPQGLGIVAWRPVDAPMAVGAV
jgi:hypothetical protein